MSVPGLSVKGQLSIGFDAGYDRNFLRTDMSGRSYTHNTSKAGFIIGIPIQYRINRTIALLTEPSFAQKNSLVYRTGAFTGVYDAYVNTYWQLPLMIRCMLGRSRYKGFLDLGLYAAYWGWGREKGATPAVLNLSDSIGANGRVDEYFSLISYDRKRAFDSRKDRRLEAGWVAGGGLSYQLNKKYTLFIQARYTGSFTDQQKHYMILQVPRYNETWYISAGGLFLLAGKTSVHRTAVPHE